MKIRVLVNSRTVEADVEPRLLLSDFLRHTVGLTGTHVGCEHGVCGACNVLLDGRAVRSCLLLAVQADGRQVVTVEGLGGPDGLHPVQEAFLAQGAFQCGYCTPGFLIALAELAPELTGLDDDDLRRQLAGTICRCTGYGPIVAAAREVAP
jgi:aerobic-type carbon monoxide dehydrogenase small subunit (CoxS/CutS family)